MNEIKEIEFIGNESYEDFGEWTDKVNLQHGEIFRIRILYKKREWTPLKQEVRVERW